MITIKSLKTYNINAGWRVWSFLLIHTNDGILGLSEFSESNGSTKAIDSAIISLEHLLVGKSPLNYKIIIENLKAKTIQSNNGIIQKAIASIENSLLDISGKYYNVPVYDLFGGKFADQLDVYWSHCGTSRVRAYQHIEKPAIKVNNVKMKTFEIIYNRLKNT